MLVEWKEEKVVSYIH